MMKSQLASPTFTPTYAALVAIINTKFPEIGELLLKRVISQVNAGCIVAVSERTKKQCRQSIAWFACCFRVHGERSMAADLALGT